MTTATPPLPAGERRAEPRRHFRAWWNLVYGGLRLAAHRVNDLRLAAGAVLVAGVALTVIATVGFTYLADAVMEGATQRFDNMVLTWMSTHRVPWIEMAFQDITMLGTGVVVGVTVVVSGTFLYLTRHKYSAALLLIATFGGILLDGLLKVIFQRPRPHFFPWTVNVVSSSFPSGHSMNAAVVYGTVAYLAARLQKKRSSRWLTMAFALLMIVLICSSRVYLGVHYPSDVLGGIIVGLAWAAMCMAMLEAWQKMAARRAPRLLKDEAPAPASAPVSAPAAPAVDAQAAAATPLAERRKG